MPLIVAIREWKEGKTSTIDISEELASDFIEYFSEKRKLGRKILSDNFNDDVEYYLLALTFGLRRELEDKDQDLEFLRATVEILLGTLDDVSLGKPYYIVEKE